MAMPARPSRQRAVWLFWGVIIAAVLVLDVILVALLVASG